MAPLVVVDIAARATEDPDAQVTPDDLTAWISANGPIPDGACVAMYSGWAGKTGEEGYRNADGEGMMHFTSFQVEATQMLGDDITAVGMAVDTLSFDHGPSGDFDTHCAWLPTGRYGIENLAGLSQLPASSAMLIVGAPTHRGGTGGPCRVMALV